MSRWAGLLAIAALPVLLNACGKSSSDDALMSEAASGGSASSGGASSGGTAAGGVPSSGGTGSGGLSSGGAESGGTTSGGADGSGGVRGDPEFGGTEFVLPFLRQDAFGMGQPLVATRNNSMLTVGEHASAEILPDALDEAFLAEYSVDGALVNALALTGAAMPELLAIDVDGNIFLVGQLYQDTTFGGFTLSAVESGFYLVKVAPDFSILDAVSSTLGGGSPLSAMAVDAEGDVVVGLGEYSDNTTVQKPLIRKFSGSTLEELWSVHFEHDISQAYTTAITFNANGEVVVGGVFTGVLTVGETVLTKAGGLDDPIVYNGWLAWLDPELGTPLRAISFGGGSFDSVNDLETTESGRLLVLATQTFPSGFLDSTEAHDDGLSGSFLYDVRDAGTVNWGRMLKEQDYFGRVLALGSEGQSYVAGRFGEIDATGGRIARFEADGTQTASLDVSSDSPNGLTHIAVDTHGGVWMSWASEAPFEFGGKTFDLGPDGGQFILRKNDF